MSSGVVSRIRSEFGRHNSNSSEEEPETGNGDRQNNSVKSSCQVRRVATSGVDSARPPEPPPLAPQSLPPSPRSESPAGPAVSCPGPPKLESSRIVILQSEENHLDDKALVTSAPIEPSSPGIEEAPAAAKAFGRRQQQESRAAAADAPSSDAAQPRPRSGSSAREATQRRARPPAAVGSQWSVSSRASISRSSASSSVEAIAADDGTYRRTSSHQHRFQSAGSTRQARDGYTFQSPSPPPGRSRTRSGASPRAANARRRGATSRGASPRRRGHDDSVPHVPRRGGRSPSKSPPRHKLSGYAARRLSDSSDDASGDISLRRSRPAEASEWRSGSGVAPTWDKRRRSGSRSPRAVSLHLRRRRRRSSSRSSTSSRSNADGRLRRRYERHDEAGTMGRLSEDVPSRSYTSASSSRAPIDRGRRPAPPVMDSLAVRRLENAAYSGITRRPGNGTLAPAAGGVSSGVAASRREGHLGCRKLRGVAARHSSDDEGAHDGENSSDQPGYEHTGPNMGGSSKLEGRFLEDCRVGPDRREVTGGGSSGMKRHVRATGARPMIRRRPHSSSDSDFDAQPTSVSAGRRAKGTWPSGRYSHSYSARTLLRDHDDEPSPPRVPAAPEEQTIAEQVAQRVEAEVAAKVREVLNSADFRTEVESRLKVEKAKLEEQMKRDLAEEKRRILELFKQQEIEKQLQSQRLEEILTENEKMVREEQQRLAEEQAKRDEERCLELERLQRQKEQLRKQRRLAEGARAATVPTSSQQTRISFKLGKT